MHEAATMYYLQQATQAQIAAKLKMSRPTVSRLLAEALRVGIVTIDVAPLAVAGAQATADRLAEALALDEVRLVEPAPPMLLGQSLAPAVSDLLQRSGLHPGAVLVTATGRTVHELVQAELPTLSGIVIAPGVGGQNEPEAWYQANEITRLLAARVGGHPTFLYAPAMPGPALRDLLARDPSSAHVFELWERASCALLGIGAPPQRRVSIATGIPTRSADLADAVGDVCLRFFDADGAEVSFPGAQDLVALTPARLREIPVTIGVAVGPEKVPSIIGAARGGYVKQLVTDVPTAVAILEALDP